jgi:hypothetical protein
MHKLMGISAFIACLTIVSASAALSAGTGENAVVGDCISDVIYGNEPNMADGTAGGPAEQEPGTKGGNVLPSQSPGPFVTAGATEFDPPRNDRVRGDSVGDLNQIFGGGAVNEFCRTID